MVVKLHNRQFSQFGSSFYTNVPLIHIGLHDVMQIRQYNQETGMIVNQSDSRLCGEGGMGV